MTQLSEEQQEPTKAIALGKYHVLRFDKGHYSYECDRGLLAGGPWDNRPKQCNGIGCRRELVEQSTLDAAIESAAIAMRDKCVADLDQQRNRMLHLYQQIFTMKSTGDPQHPLQACIDYDAKVAFEEALESLTLDQVKPGEM